MIIFQEGYLLKKRYFFKYFYFIFLYGIIGTLLTFIIVYPLNLLISNSDMIVVDNEVIHLDSYRIFLFSAIVSSSECLSAKPFVDHHKFPKLFNIMYGEQAMNDLIVFSLVIASAETYKEQLQHAGTISPPNLTRCR